MMVKACGGCKMYEMSKLNYFVSKTGAPSQKRFEYELRKSISEDVDVSFPIYAKIVPSSPSSGKVFLPLLRSAGCSVIIRDEKDEAADLAKMIFGMLKIWPLLLISYAIATIAGTLVWLLVRNVYYPMFSCVCGAHV